MPNLKFKADWNRIKKCYTSWWNCQNTEPIFNMHIYHESGSNRSSVPLTPADKWLDIDSILANEENIMELSSYLADGYPGVTPYLGPGSLGTFLGAIPEFEMGTVWYEPCYDDICKADIIFDKSSRWWNWTLKFINMALQKGKGKYLVEMPDLCENLDTIAAIVGTQPLLYHLYDYPEEVHRLQKKILPVWFNVFETLYQLIKDEDGGMCFGFFGIWAPGRMAKLQCDFSAMISPDMFSEFVFPYLKEQSDKLDYALYHLDGPGELPHLEQILSIDSIQALQWVPLPGIYDPGDPYWDTLYRRILDAGKALHLSMSVESVEPFIKRMGKKGILIRTNPKSDKQAYEIINKSINW